MSDFERGFNEELEKIAFSWADPVAGAGMGALGGAALGGALGLPAGPGVAALGAGIGAVGGGVLGGAAGGLGSMLGLGKRKPKPKPDKPQALTVNVKGGGRGLSGLKVPNLAPPPMPRTTLTGTMT